MKMENNKLDPNWITGFVDAEGCFSITLCKDIRQKVKWRIQPKFRIKLHSRDEDLLKDIRLYFNCGNIYRSKSKESKEYKKITFMVCDMNSINNVLIPHFDKYPLITQKLKDYLLWKNIVELMNKKEHLNFRGLRKIVALMGSLNKGL